MSPVGQQGGVALGDIGDRVEAMPGKDVSHSSSHHSGETSNCAVFSDRLGLFVSLMHALLSWQQQILLSLNGILKKLPLKISSYLTRYYQGMKTFLFNRDVWSLLICRIFRVGLRKGNTNQQLLISQTLECRSFQIWLVKGFHGKDCFSTQLWAAP